MSGSIARITEPFGAFFAVCSAAHIVPPPEMPVRRPSFDARSFAVAIASAGGIGSSSSCSEPGASSSTFGMKSGVHPWIGCGAKAGCDSAGEPSALRVCSVPDLRSPAGSGSPRMILRSGSAAFSALPAPWKVPPVP